MEETLEKDNDLEESIKRNYSKNREKMIEDALEEFDFSNYSTYLFTPYSDVDSAIVVESSIEYISQNNLEKDAIIKILDEGKMKSLWERYFESTEIRNLQDNINEIRKLRNSVMHNKKMTHEDFQINKSLLRKSITLIDKAIIEVKTEKYFDVSISDVFISFKNVTESLQTIAEPLIQMQKVMQNFSKSIAEHFKSLNTEKFEEIKRITDFSLYKNISSFEKTIAEARKLSFKFNLENKPVISPSLKSSLLYYDSLVKSIEKIQPLSFSSPIKQSGGEERSDENKNSSEDKIKKDQENKSND